MTQVDPPPSPDEIQKRRQPKYIIDPRSVKKEEETRVRQWALALMNKHEDKLKKKTPNKHVVWSGTVEPEDIDIRQVYPFKELNWVIYRDDPFWALMLRSNAKPLAIMKYVQMETI